MKKMRCIHPRNVEKFMKEFLEFAADLEYSDEDGNFNKRMPKLHKDDRFEAFIDEDCADAPTFEIGYCFDNLMFGMGTKQFRKDFINRCPLGKGFATITMSLLHELGHFETVWYDFEDYDREAEIARILSLPRGQRNWEYFKLPDESAATDWAIDWLSKKENRIAAKQFERKFFSCFAA